MTLAMSVYIRGGTWLFWDNWQPIIDIASLGVIAYAMFAVAVELLGERSFWFMFWAIGKGLERWENFDNKRRARKAEYDNATLARVLDNPTDVQLEIIREFAVRHGITATATDPAGDNDVE